MDEFDESEASDEDVADDPDPAHLANYLRINPNLLLDHIGGLELSRPGAIACDPRGRGRGRCG